MKVRKIWQLAAFLAVSFVSQSVYAVPALRVGKRVCLEDGTKVLAKLYGDEFLNYYMTESGQALQCLDNGTYRVMSTFRLQHLRELAQERRSSFSADIRLRKARNRAGGYSGTKRGLVILVQYRDVKFSMDDPHAAFGEFFNKPGYSLGGMHGSVHDYFLEQSYGTFDLTFDVVGPYTLSKNMAYYGGNSANGGDKAPHEMVSEAYKAADADVDYTNYDWDGDGETDQIFLIYAGCSEAQGAPTDCIWPHSSSFPTPPVYDGVRVNQYACSSELVGADMNGTVIDGIGTACHEFSHCLGLMDIYDVNYTDRRGMSYWDLMDSGSYNGNPSGYCPAGYTAFERWQVGWLTPVELNAPTQVQQMKPIEETPEAYVLYNDAKRNEYYLLENRQRTGFDTGIPSTGLLAVHVDYDEAAWRSNQVNTVPTHKRLVQVPADGNLSLDFQSVAGDVYPQPGVTSLTDYSEPSASLLYNANTDGSKYLHKPVEDIRMDENGQISFYACYPLLQASAPAFSGNVLTWGKAQNLIGEKVSYELEITERPARLPLSMSTILEEDMEKTVSSTGFTDVGGKLDQYLDHRGFSGKALFLSPQKLRFGTGTSQGSLMCPVQDTLNTGSATVVLHVKPYAEGKAVNGTFTFFISAQNSPQSFTFSKECDLVFHTDLDMIGRWYFTVTAKSQFYLQHIQVLDGIFTEDELNAANRVKVQNQVRGIHTEVVQTEENSYTLKDYNPANGYSVRVRALEPNRVSPWSSTVTFGGETAIADVKGDGTPEAEVWYDLNGRRISAPVHKGLYIRNNKKVLVSE